ncbi:MAG: NADH-quinone oxidoreductase subunit B family protein [Gammaproteobacteria bacterium]
MANWPLHSLVRGVRTTQWPRREERSPGVTPGRPCAAADAPLAVAELCPTEALTADAHGVGVDFARCVHCQRCRRSDGALPWREDFEWTSAVDGGREALPSRFRRSLHVRYVDAGACGGCMGEVRLIDAPPYNLHRFGIFITASPRDADVLLVGGPVTEVMREPLRKAYEAMPEPKRVVAMGVCAINGGVFGKSFASAGGVAECIPVDLVIPGCPPPPLAIVHALLAITGRAKTHALEEQP